MRREVKDAAIGSFVALVLLGAALAAAWPWLKGRIVADLKAELDSQGVLKGAALDAATGVAQVIREFVK